MRMECTRPPSCCTPVFPTLPAWLPPWSTLGSIRQQWTAAARPTAHGHGRRQVWDLQESTSAKPSLLVLPPVLHTAVPHRAHLDAYLIPVLVGVAKAPCAMQVLQASNLHLRYSRKATEKDQRGMIYRLLLTGQRSFSSSWSELQEKAAADQEQGVFYAHKQRDGFSH